MGSLKKNLTIVLGVAAGAALTAFAVSKSGQKEIKRLNDMAGDLKDDLLSATKDLSKLKRSSKQFI